MCLLLLRLMTPCVMCFTCLCLGLVVSVFLFDLCQFVCFYSLCDLNHATDFHRLCPSIFYFFQVEHFFLLVFDCLYVSSIAHRVKNGFG